VSQSHVIYHFGKCVTISWDCGTSFGNQLLEKKFGMSSISLNSYEDHVLGRSKPNIEWEKQPSHNEKSILIYIWWGEIVLFCPLMWTAFRAYSVGCNFKCHKKKGFSHWTSIGFQIIWSKVQSNKWYQSEIMGSSRGNLITLKERLLGYNSAALITWTALRICICGVRFWMS
jgi:hypothetical protein